MYLHGFFRDSTKDPQSSNLWQLRFLTQVLQSQVPTNALQTTGYELLGGNDVFFFFFPAKMVGSNFELNSWRQAWFYLIHLFLTKNTFTSNKKFVQTFHMQHWSPLIGWSWLEMKQYYQTKLPSSFKMTRLDSPQERSCFNPFSGHQDGSKQGYFEEVRCNVLFSILLAPIHCLRMLESPTWTNQNDWRGWS